MSSAVKSGAWSVINNILKKYVKEGHKTVYRIHEIILKAIRIVLIRH